MISMRPVFVSHAHADNELCDRYVAALRNHGVDVWYDRTNLQNGRLLSGEISAQLRLRTAFVLLLTSAAVRSFWVNLELNAYLTLLAHDSSRLFVPVRIQSCEVPALLGGIKWIDAVSIGFDATLEAIIATLILEPEESERHIREQEPALDGEVRSTHPEAASWTEEILKVIQRNHERARVYLEGYESILRRDPDNVAVLIAKADALAYLGQEEALHIFDRVLVLDPDNAHIKRQRAYHLENLGRIREALAVFRDFVASNPFDAASWSKVTQLLARCGLRDEALKAYNDALVAYDYELALDPNNHSVWLEKAAALSELGRSKEAQDAYERVEEIEAQWPDSMPSP